MQWYWDIKEKDFRVFLIDRISETELFILNRQEELVFYSATNSIPVETPSLIWDGKSNGKYVPSRNYSFVIVSRNPLFGINERLTGSLLVIKKRCGMVFINPLFCEVIFGNLLIVYLCK